MAFEGLMTCGRFDSLFSEGGKVFLNEDISIKNPPCGRVGEVDWNNSSHIDLTVDMGSDFPSTSMGWPARLGRPILLRPWSKESPVTVHGILVGLTPRHIVVRIPRYESSKQ